MDKREKYRVWLLAGLALLALFILAAGLSELELAPGWPFSVWWRLLFGDLNRTSDAVVALPFGSDYARIARVLATVFLILIILFVIGFILYPDLRKRMLREVLRLVVILLLASILMNSGFMENLTQMVEPVDLSNAEAPEMEMGESELADLPEFEANSPPWLTWIASFVLALALVAGVMRLVWSMSRRMPTSTPMQDLAKEAQAALDALHSGADFRNTIIRCYREMSEVLRTQRGIQRDEAMTPREFEERLTRHGLPGDPVRQLTRLFEWVRYGAAAPGELEEDQAITSLSAIVEACRSAGR